MTTAQKSPFPVADDVLEPSSLAEGLHTARLANGLRVIIREDHRTEVAICNVWVKVGSNREPEPMRGWSHGIEHMLFKGTERRDEGDFAQEVASAGGSTNAGTGYETTNYHITLPSGNIDQAIDILGDSLFHSKFVPDSLDAERQVLVHENHMYDDIPFGFGVTWRWGCELTFDMSPYRHPIGGRDENLLERDRGDILAFWRSAYRPDNMTLVVVGAVDSADVFALVQEKFGQVDPALFPSESGPCSIVAEPPTEPDHDAPRLKIAYGDIKKAYAKLIFPAPGEKQGLDAILSVVSRVLSDGRSCRLYRQVQEQQKLVDDFAVMAETGPREGIILFDMETGPKRLAQALVEIVRVLEDLKTDGCTEAELQRAITRVSRGFLFSAETVQGQASSMGHNDVNDDLAASFNFPEQVAAVTSDDVRNFCRSVFRLGNLSAVIYLPEGTDAAAHGIPAEVEALTTLLGPVLGANDSVAVPAPAPHAAATAKKRPDRRAAEHPHFETVQLGNGIEVCYRIDKAVPILTMSMTSTGGTTAETQANAGLSTLTQAVMIKGAGGLDAESLHEILEGQGASLSPQADRDFSGLFLSALSGQLDQGFELMGKTISDPTFAEAEIEQEKRLALEQLASVDDNPVQAAALRLRHMMFGDHPYGRPLPGTETSIPAHTQADLKARHQQNWTADKVKVVVSGDLDPDDLLPRLETLLSALPAGQGAAQVIPGPAQIPNGVVSETMIRQQNQSVVLVAWPGPIDTTVDRVPLILLKEILNGQSGRLFETLRNRQSLCYNTGVMSTAGFGQGLFMGYVLTAPDTAEKARAALVQEVLGLGASPVGEVEFERARAELLGHMLISSQSNASRVSRAARDRIYGRGPDNLSELIEQVMACTAAEVQDVAGRMFSADDRYEVQLGPAKP
jgi:zinc protease